MFLSFLYNLFCDIHSLFPFDLATFTGDYFRSFVTKWIFFIDFVLKIISFCQNFIFKIIILPEFKLWKNDVIMTSSGSLRTESESHLIWIFSELASDIFESFKNWLIVVLDCLIDWWRWFEDCQPEIRNSLLLEIMSVTMMAIPYSIENKPFQNLKFHLWLHQTFHSLLQSLLDFLHRLPLHHNSIRIQFQSAHTHREQLSFSENGSNYI